MRTSYFMGTRPRPEGLGVRPDLALPACKALRSAMPRDALITGNGAAGAFALSTKPGQPRQVIVSLEARTVCLTGEQADNDEHRACSLIAHHAPVTRQ
jgi:hypothetical protein